MACNITHPEKNLENTINNVNTNKIVATIVIVTYRSENEIEDCINSLLSQSFKAYEIIVVDNSPDDNTVSVIKKHFPFIYLIVNRNNLGYGAGNNIGVTFAHGEYIVILNPDTVVDQNWLEELLNPIVANERLITTSKILTKDGSMINTCGNVIHFSGLAFTRGYGMKPDTYPNTEVVGEFSGCSFAIKKTLYSELGGFDSNIFLYHDDVDFSIRARLRGINILYVPTSVVFHDYTLNVSPQKLYYLEKGRYMLLRKYLTKSQIMWIIPSLLITEVLTFCYAAKFGKAGIIYKIKAFRDGMMQYIQKIDGDKKDLLNVVTPKIPEDQLTSNSIEYYAKVIANIFYSLNYKALLWVY